MGDHETSIPAIPRLQQGLVGVTTFLASGITIGTGQYSFGFFVDPLEKDFDWTRTQVNLALTVGMVCFACGTPLIGTLIDRYGAKPLMLVSLFLQIMGFVTRALLQNLITFYVSQALIMLGTPGATFFAAGRLIPLWFPNSKGKAMGVITAGNNILGLVTVQLGTALVQAYSWRATSATFAGIIALITVLVAIFIHEKPTLNVEGKQQPSLQKVVDTLSSSDEEVSNNSGTEDDSERGDRTDESSTKDDEIPGVTLQEAFRTSAFYKITCALVCLQFTYASMLSQIIPHLISVDFSRETAALGMTVVALAGASSKLASGFLADRITARWTSFICAVIQIISCFIFATADGSWREWLGVSVYGLGFGGVGAMIPLLVSEVFGLRSFGKLLGVIQLANLFPGIVGPVIAGVTFDNTGSYETHFYIHAGIFFCAACFLSIARPPSQERILMLRKQTLAKEAHQLTMAQTKAMKGDDAL